MNELAVLVYSCWKNSDMWSVFMQLFRKYWKECRYQVILLTDKVDDRDKYGFDDVIVLDGNWREMVLAGLDAAGTEYVMLCMDDYLLCDYVKNEDIVFYVQAARKYHAANIRLVESPSIVPTTFAMDRNMNFYKPGTAYSVSTQAGIWNVSLLRVYMKHYDSPWDFERRGSIEIKDDQHPFLAPKNYVFPYEEAVRRGKWLDSGVRLCKRNNIKLDFKRRRQKSNFELSWIYFKGGILEMNPTLVVKMQNFIDIARRYVLGKK